MSVDHTIQRQGVNRFLSDLYGSKQLLSGILKGQGMSNEELQIIQAAVDPFVAEMVQVWQNWWAEILDERRCTVLVRRYGLDGEEPDTLQEIGERFGLSRERVRQLHKGALRRLSTSGRKSTLERLVLEQAQMYTGESLERTKPTHSQGEINAH